MKKHFDLRVAIAFGILALMPVAYPCSWAIGYFHQVTHLRGKVVGVANGDWRHPFRWMRQRVARRDTRLVLRDYVGPANRHSELPIVKAVTTDAYGEFDFGAIRKGHYTLQIEAPWGGDSFDVEITSLPRPIDRVILDISPVHPDCTGGHEFYPLND